MIFYSNYYIPLSEGSPYSSLKSSLKAGQLIEHTAQSPDVTLLVVGLSFTQLWRNVARGPNHLSEKQSHYIMLNVKNVSNKEKSENLCTVANY